MQNRVSDSMAGELSNADMEKQKRDAAEYGGVETSENAVGGQSRDLVVKIIDVVVVDCQNKGESRGERDSNANIDKQQSEGMEVAAGNQSEELVEKIIDVVVVDCSNKGESRGARDSNAREECRVCQEETEEGLINLGCHCRGALAKAHHSCIIKWFQTRGSNKCEICQQIATNLPAVDPQPSYWVWRVDPAYSNGEYERNYFAFFWVALSILVAGLVMDVMISITFGVSAIPTNIIIGVIIALGLGTAIRLVLDYFREWNVRRAVQDVQENANLAYHPAL